VISACGEGVGFPPESAIITPTILADSQEYMTDAQPTPPAQRLRITFAKLGAMKYIGHLDLAKTWERILRRAQIGLAYSQGFNARPKMHLPSPLPLGFTSSAEIIDIWLREPIPIAGLAERLTAVSPPGLPIQHIQEIPLKSPSVQAILRSSVYTLTLREGELPDLAARVADLLAQPSILRERRDKAYDLRPLIMDLVAVDPKTLQMELVITPQGTAGRPDEVAEALGTAAADWAIHRTAITLRAESEAIEVPAESDESAESGESAEADSGDEP